MTDFAEVAPRVWVSRRPWFDASVTVVGGERGLLVVDTHGSTAAGRAVVDDVRRLVGDRGLGEVVGVVNTHWHFDHTFGNAAFREAFGPVPVTAHEDAAEELDRRAEEVRQRYAEDAGDPHRDDVLATDVVVPDDTFSSARVLDLGDRVVELVHPGRGHTAGDLVAFVPDADVVLAGDVVEESAPPAYGDDCYPLDWPHSLDTVLGLLTSSTLVVPGHGRPVDRDFVEQQRNEIGLVAQTLRDLAAAGVPEEEALAAGEWPWERDRLEHAVARGYAHLPRGARQLPLA